MIGGGKGETRGDHNNSQPAREGRGCPGRAPFYRRSFVVGIRLRIRNVRRFCRSLPDLETVRSANTILADHTPRTVPSRNALPDSSARIFRKVTRAISQSASRVRNAWCEVMSTLGKVSSRLNSSSCRTVLE